METRGVVGHRNRWDGRDHPAGAGLERDVARLRAELGPLVLDRGEELRVSGAGVHLDDRPLCPRAVRVLSAAPDRELGLRAVEAVLDDRVIVGTRRGEVGASRRRDAQRRASVLNGRAV